MKITHPILTRHILTAPTVESLESRIVPSGIGDLFVSINDGKDSTAEPGDTLIYDINYGYGLIKASFPALSGVKLTVNLDPNLSFVPSDNTGSGWGLVSNTLTKNIGALDNGGSGSAPLKLRVKDFISANGYYSGVNTTVVISEDGDHFESNTQNNRANDNDTFIGLTVDPTITGITDPVFAQEGHQATFTVLYNNLGNTDVFSSGTSITVTLPDEVSFNGVESDSRWNDNQNGTITAYDITIPAGNTEDLGISYVVDVSYFKGERSPLETRAQISSSEQIPETNSENNDEIEFTPIYTGFIVTAPGVAIKNRFAPPTIRVFDKSTGEALYSFSAYEPKYRDSIRVAVGDFNGDGVDDIVTTTMHNGGRMRFFDGLTGERFSEGPLSAEVAVFGHAKNAGAFVAVGNISGNNLMQPTVVVENSGNHPEIVVGSSLGGGKVKVYSLDFQPQLQAQEIVPFGGNIQALTVIKEYTPFGAKFKGGVRVAVGDVDYFGVGKGLQPALFNGTEDDIIVGQGFGGNKVKVYKGATSEELMTFTVGGAKYRGGVSVGSGYVNQDSFADIIVGRNSGKPSVAEVFDGRTGLDEGTIQQIGSSITPFDSDPLNPKNTYGVRVAVGDVNGDGIADIITSVGVRKGSKVKIYDGASLLMNQVSLIEDRTITAYSQFPNVALWVAASKQVFYTFDV